MIILIYICICIGLITKLWRFPQYNSRCHFQKYLVLQGRRWGSGSVLSFEYKQKKFFHQESFKIPFCTWMEFQFSRRGESQQREHDPALRVGRQKTQTELKFAETIRRKQNFPLKQMFKILANKVCSFSKCMNKI